MIDHVIRLKYDDTPNYCEIHKKINETLKVLGYSNDEDFRIVSIESKKYQTFNIIFAFFLN